MPVIFLSENNSLSKKVLKNSFQVKNVSLFEVPLKKMKKRAFASFKERISKSDFLFLAEPSLSSLLPETDTDFHAFFDSVIIKVAESILKRKNLFPCRFVIHNPTEDMALSALDIFSDIALYGSNALSVSNFVFRKTGAAIPITSGLSASDAVLCDKAFAPDICAFAFGYNMETSEKSFGKDGLKFYPGGEYSLLLSLSKRPLTLEEAALLSDYDKKATFNIAF